MFKVSIAAHSKHAAQHTLGNRTIMATVSAVWMSLIWKVQYSMSRALNMQNEKSEWPDKGAAREKPSV